MYTLEITHSEAMQHENGSLEISANSPVKVTVKLLPNIDEVGIRVDTLQLTRHQQALYDADMLGAQFTPAEQPVSAVMESFP